MTTINTDLQSTSRSLFRGHSPPALRTRRVALELEGLKLSRELGCGCIPFIPAHQTRWRTDEPIEQKPSVDPALLEGYKSLRGKSPIYRKHIVDAYKSIGLGRSEDKASSAKLDLFIEEVEETLGEGKNKTNLIIDGLPKKPQKQRTPNNNIDRVKFERLVADVRPDQVVPLQESLANGSSWVALAQWIAREKANKETQAKL